MSPQLVFSHRNSEEDSGTSQGAAGKERENSDTTDQTFDSQEKGAFYAVKDVATTDGEAENQTTTTADSPIDTDPLSNLTGEGVNYKSCSWWHCGWLMIAEVVSLGILSLPWALAQIGIVPGVISILGLGALSTYTGYVVGQFKLKYPSVFNMADAGYILFGTVGYWGFYAAAQLSFVFIMAAHIVTFAKAMHILTNNATCSPIWAVVGVVLSIVLTLPRTLRNISYFSISSSVSVVTAVLIVMIAVGIQHKHISETAEAFVQYTSFDPPVSAVLSITIAFMGNVAFFNFISELRDPRDFPKSLYLLQGCTITLYLVVALVIYIFVGKDVQSPALSSASPVIEKIGYGVAMPTIIVAGVVNASVACKSLYIQVWRWCGKPDTVKSRSLAAVGSWAAIVSAAWILAGLLALAIPIFHELLGLISALFGSWFTYGIPGMFWIKMNWPSIKSGVLRIFRRKGVEAEKSHEHSWKKAFLLALNIFLILLGVVMCILGLVVSGKQIKASQSSVGKPFACLEPGS